MEERKMAENTIFKGTFLDEVLKLAEANNFDELELKPVKDGEEVIAEMTALEKAIFTRGEIIAKEVNSTCLGCRHRPEDHATDKCKHIKMLKEHFETLGNLGWRVIEERLNHHDGNLGIREGYQIVKLPEAQEFDLRLGGLGVTIIGLGGSRD